MEQTKFRLLILNGPNLNMLEKREPEFYGSNTLASIERLCAGESATLGMAMSFRQSNFEGDLVTAIQDAPDDFDGIILNAAAYTHTSIAIHDALKTANLPLIEVHLSNVYAREQFRHISYVSPLADGVICGLGADGYKCAIHAIHKMFVDMEKAKKV